VDATAYRGARTRLRGKLRTANHATGRLWLRVDHGDSRGFFDHMARHPVVSATWAQGEIIGTVDADATKIVFGELMLGVGTAWYDDVKLSVETNDGNWKAIAIRDAGFEAPDPLESWSPGAGNAAQGKLLDGWSVTVDHGQPASGAASLRMEAATKVVTEELFEQAPAAGETMVVDLSSGLRARVPIALYSKDNHTIGDDPESARRSQTVRSSTTPARFDVMAAVADVIVFWNVFEHFWPYWDAVSVDWNAELDTALSDALDDHDVDDRVATLERLTAAAPDGHVSVSCLGELERAYPPFAVDLVEDQIVVTTSADQAVRRGDVLVSIDGRPILQLLAAERARISGSPQWQTASALERLGRGPLGSTLDLRLHRGDTDLTVSVSRIDRRVPEERLHPLISALMTGSTIWTSLALR
jgi:hypothetical protein